MDPIKIIGKYFEPGSQAHTHILEHSAWVARAAGAIAERFASLGPDMAFIREAALLHDIGVCQVHFPAMGCHGSKEYIHHGCLGRAILEQEGLPRHALVCERHVGVGITREEILARNLGLPERDMVPLSLEERIICYADKFHSKNGEPGGVVKSVDDIAASLARHGGNKAATFLQWMEEFGLPPQCGE